MGEDDRDTLRAGEEGETKPGGQERPSSGPGEAAEDEDDLSCVAELGYD